MQLWSFVQLHSKQQKEDQKDEHKRQAEKKISHCQRGVKSKPVILSESVVCGVVVLERIIFKDVSNICLVCQKE